MTGVAWEGGRRLSVALQQTPAGTTQQIGRRLHVWRRVTGVRIEVRPRSQLADADLEEWRALAQVVHPTGRPRLGSDIRWATSEPTDYLVRAWDDENLLACAWITERKIAVDEERTRVAGIRGVMTHPNHRRRGYGRAVMLHAQAHIDWVGSAEFAMLFSSVMAVPFYESLGWRAVAVPVFCRQPEGRIDFTKRLPDAPVMVRTPSGNAPPDVRAIDIRGLPW